MQIRLQALEHLSDNETARIHSHPECANGPCKPPTPAQFDTILMCVDEQGHKMGGFQGKSIICAHPKKINDIVGLRVAKVWVIFQLPPHLCLYPHPLVYVHLFKLLCTFDENINMFHFGHSTYNNIPNVVVVPITNLVQPCHLVPRFSSGTLNPCWCHGDSMNAADTFFLNQYINMHTFEQYRVHRSK